MTNLFCRSKYRTNFLSWLVLVFLFGCAKTGGSTGTAAAAGPITVFTLTPSAGTYDFAPIVTFTPPTGVTMSGLEFQNLDGTYSYKGGNDCSTGGISSSYCLALKTTTTWLFRPWISSDTPQSATYTITNSKRNITINNVEFQEERTKCKIYLTDSQTIQVSLKLSSESFLGSTKIAYLNFHVLKSSVGQISTIADDMFTGVSIRGSGDTEPSVMNYSPGAYNITGDSCIVNLALFNAGGLVSGSIACTNLNQQMTPDYTDFGSIVNVTEATWQCDYWE